jgi:putative addiction module CopG family antidote
MIIGMESVTLPPDLERFAAEAVAAGRYPDLSAVVEAGVNLLRRTEAASAALLASVNEAQAEGDREGYLAADDVTARVASRLAGRSPASR